MNLRRRDWISLTYEHGGFLAKVNVPINKKQKLEQKIVDCAFLGYAFNNMG